MGTLISQHGANHQLGLGDLEPQIQSKLHFGTGNPPLTFQPQIMVLWKMTHVTLESKLPSLKLTASLP